MKSYRYINFNLHKRSELILAMAYAESHGFQLDAKKYPRYQKKLHTYNGGVGAFSVWVNPKDSENMFGCGFSHVHQTQESQLHVTTLSDFKRALDTFYHDGYINDDNFKV